MGTGTGKTLTSLTRFTETPTHNLLVFCPHSITSQWTYVIETHFPHLTVLKYSKKNLTSAQKNEEIKQFMASRVVQYKVVIVNYELSYRLPSLTRINNDWMIIVDESHRIKNHKAKSTKAILNLGTKTEWKVILTATPAQGVKGGYVDYYTQLKFIDQINYGFETFERKYIKYSLINYSGSTYPVKTITGYLHTHEIDELLQLCSRYYKPKWREEEPYFNKVVFDKVPSYDKLIREKAYKEISITSQAKKRLALLTLTGGTILGYDAVNNRHTYQDNTAKLDWLEDFLTDTDEPVVLFYRYNVELDAITSLLKRLKKTYRVINGKTKDKYAEVTKEWDVMVGQFQAMSESLDGLHLKSHIEVFYSMPDSSLVYQQAIGRIDRDGQTFVPIYYFLVMKGTVDEDIYNMIENKIEYTSATLDKLLLDYNEVLSDERITDNLYD